MRPSHYGLIGAAWMWGLLNTALAQPELLWSRTYGGQREDYAYFVSLVDGGFVVAGHADFPDQGGQDLWLLKTNEDGDTLWTRRIGAPSVEYVWAGVRTSDNGYAFAGEASPPFNGWNFWFVKTSFDGAVQIDRNYGTSLVEAAHAVCQTSDGGYVLAGERNEDIWIVRTNSIGDSLWSRTFGASGIDDARSIVEADDGGFVIAGWSENGARLLKVSADGDSLWGKTLNKPLRCVRRTTDGGYILAGNSFGDYWLAKTDADGDTLWSSTFGGPEYDLAFALEQTNDGGYVMAGMTQSFGHGQANEGDFWLVRASPEGDSLWSQTFGGTGDDVATALQVLPDGGYLLAGYTHSYGAGGSDFWLVRTTPDPVFVNDGIPLLPFDISLSCLPNPFNPSTTIVYDLPKAGRISLRVFDLLGREVSVMVDEFAQAGTHRVTFDGSGLASGIYFARLEAGGFSQTRKLMLLK